MATPQEIKKETELLAGLGLPRVKVWPPRCDWYTKDGELRKNMPCDPYSRIQWLSRGMRPDIWRSKKKITTGYVDKTPAKTDAYATLLDAVVGLGNWEGTSTDLFTTIELVTDDIPDSPSRLSRDIGELTEQLQVRGVTFTRFRDRRSRRMVFRHTNKESVTATPVTAETVGV